MKKYHIPLRTYIILIFLLFSSITFAQDTELTTSGFARSRFAVQVDDGNLYINEQLLSASMEWRSDTAAAHAGFTVIAENGTTVKPDLQELYIDWFGNSFDLRIGKQKILWGKADGVFITDLVSPKNLSSFLTKDISELRLGVTGIKFDYFAGPHQLEAVWLPVFTPTILPSPMSIWAVSPNFSVLPTITPVVHPEASLENAEYFARYSYLGSDFDLQVMGGWFWNDTPIATITSKTVAPGPVLTSISIQPEYYQVAVAGLAASLPLGPLVIKGETAHTWNQRYQANFMKHPEGWAEKNALQYLVGGDISFIGATLSVQWVQDSIFDYDESLFRDEILNSMTAILQRSFNRETIKAEVFTVVSFTDRDAMIKPLLSWIPGNGFQISLGGWFFFGDTGQFGQYAKNNGIFLSTAYYF